MKGNILINKKLCKECNYCVLNCPKKLIKIEELEINDLGYHPAKFDDVEGKCVGCAICAIVCPEVAIEVFQIEEKKEE